MEEAWCEYMWWFEGFLRRNMRKPEDWIKDTLHYKYGQESNKKKYELILVLDNDM